MRAVRSSLAWATVVLVGASFGMASGALDRRLAPERALTHRALGAPVLRAASLGAFPGEVFQSAPTDTLAFPGAVGGGATAWGKCHGIALDNPDSLFIRYIDPDATAGTVEAIDAVVDSVQAHSADACHISPFRHGGEVTATFDPSDASVKNWMVLGQLAGEGGSEGVVITNNAVSGGWGQFDHDSEHIVLTYVRVRPNDPACLHLEDVEYVLLGWASHSHCSTQGGRQAGWGLGGEVSTGDRTDYLTDMYNLFTWADDEHPTVQRLGGGLPRSDPPSDSVTGYASLYIGPGQRVPVLGGGAAQAIRTIAFNWSNRPAEMCGGDGVHDIIGHYSKPGPATGGGTNNYRFLGFLVCDVGYGNTHTIYARGITAAKTGYDATVSVDNHWADNADRLIGCRDIDGAASEIITCSTHGDSITDADQSTVRAANAQDLYGPYDGEIMDTTSQTTAEAEALADSVGVWRVMGADGEWVAARDAFDALRVEEFKDSTATTEPFINSVGSCVQSSCLDSTGFVLPATGSTWTDADGDGIPASSDPDDNDPSDAKADPDGDGFITLVEFAFGYDPNVFTEPDGTEGSSTTFGTNVNIYICRDLDTIPIIQGSPPDTLNDIRCAGVGPEVGGLRGPIDGDSMLWRVEGTVSPTDGTLLDSAEVVDLCDGTPFTCDIDRLRGTDRTPSAMIELVPFTPTQAALPHEPPKPEGPPKIERFVALEEAA